MSADVIRAGTEVRVLSVQQPWASLLVFGVLDVINRPRDLMTWVGKEWGPLRGEVFIHASRCVNEFAYREFLGLYPALCLLSTSPRMRGRILGSVEVVDSTLELRSRWHARGQWGHYVKNARVLDRSVEVKGKLGVWAYTFQWDVSLVKA